MEIKTVSVLGANGVMGRNVSAIFAAFGDAKVYMISRDIEKSKLAAQLAVKSVRADSIAANLIPADYSMLAGCIGQSDLVFESVEEKLETKLGVMEQIAALAGPDTIIGSGTSGLSVTKIAEALPQALRRRCFGIHMFNPPYHLNLCEATPTKYSDKAVFEELKRYLTKQLHRTTVEVSDSPAFLGNRVGFQFINLALQYAQRYKHNGGIDYIDTILGPHTGRIMAPIVTADFVGLDVHKAIVDNIRCNISDYANDTFKLPEYVEEQIRKKKLGRKTKEGLYKKEETGGDKRLLVYDIATGMFREKMDYHFPFAEQMKRAIHIGDYKKAIVSLVENQSMEAQICLSFLLQYIVYALSVAAEVGSNLRSADDVMACGFNWCPPLALAEAFGLAYDLQGLFAERLDKTVANEVDIAALIERMEPSRYDFRAYLRS